MIERVGQSWGHSVHILPKHAKVVTNEENQRAFLGE